MLPTIKLRDVSRDDVDRVAWWLEDDELSTAWFGHYACGDPVHRGYEPRHMLEATELEWGRVFGDPMRRILSIYGEGNEHIGECQVVFDGGGGAELSLLIGRKDLWHRGFGTATVVTLLDRVLDSLDLDTVWVSVPEDNPAALGLFEKLGFVRGETREVCGRRDDTALKVCILAIDARARRGRQAGGNKVPVITISGLPGSGSEVVGLEVARLLGSRYVDDEITERLRRRLRCSLGELRSLEQSTLSLWSRLLRAIAIPVAWQATSDIGFHPLMSDPIADFGLAEDQITRERYLEGLSTVIARLSAEGGVVIHGHGTPRLVPSQLGADHVFLSASQASRQRRIAAERGLGAPEALTLVRHMDREAIALNKNLYGGDLLDMSQYDLVLNLDRISLESAARVVAGAFRVPSPQGNIWTEEAAPPSRVAV